MKPITQEIGRDHYDIDNIIEVALKLYIVMTTIIVTRLNYLSFLLFLHSSFFF